MRKRDVLPLLLGLVLLSLSPYTMAKDHTRTITVELTLPGSAYTFEIEEVRLVKGELWALSRVKPAGIGTAAITTAKAKAKLVAPVDISAAKIRQFVRGKTWRWDDDQKNTIHLKPKQNPPEPFATSPVLFAKKAAKEKKPEVALWIFTMHDDNRLDEEAARKLVADHKAGFKKHLGAIGMFFADATEAQAKKIKEHPAIKFAEKDR